MWLDFRIWNFHEQLIPVHLIFTRAFIFYESDCEKKLHITTFITFIAFITPLFVLSGRIFSFISSIWMTLTLICWNSLHLHSFVSISIIISPSLSSISLAGFISFRPFNSFTFCEDWNYCISFVNILLLCIFLSLFRISHLLFFIEPVCYQFFLFKSLRFQMLSTWFKKTNL